MRSIVLVVTLGLLLSVGVSHAITVNGDLSDWGAWSTFNSGEGRFDANANVQFRSNWDSTDDVVTAGNSGGEWFDIEGLYVRFTRETSGDTYLNWAIVTSHAGLEPWSTQGGASSYAGTGEWNPTWTGDPTTDGANYNPNRGAYAYERDGNNPLAFNYHRNPVIGLNLDGVNGYEYGLLLDPTDSGVGRGDFAIGTTTPTLYSIAPTSNAWVYATDFPAQEPVVDFKTGITGVTQVATGTGIRVVGYDENRSLTDHQNTQASWRMDYNWYWEGRINVTTAITENFSVAKNRSVHYALWCGNDGVKDTASAAFNGSLVDPNPTPELGTWMLLGCTGLFGLGAVGWRRRKTA